MLLKTLNLQVIMMKISIENETQRLRVVLVGIANNLGGTPKEEECYDPKSREHVKAGTFPVEKDCIKEVNSLVQLFKKYKVEVLRPQNIKGLNQIFPRDIAFAIDNKLVISNVIKDRQEEVSAIYEVLNQIAKENIIIMPEDVRAEGGDVIPWNDYIFVGYSKKEDFEDYIVARTNKAVYTKRKKHNHLQLGR